MVAATDARLSKFDWTETDLWWAVQAGGAKRVDRERTLYHRACNVQCKLLNK